MRVFVCILISFICLVNTASAIELADKLSSQLKAQRSQVEALRKHRETVKLYAPNFVVIGNEAEFKVFAKPDDRVIFVLDYGSTIPKQTLEQRANDKGVAVFNPTIIDDKNLVGKSVAIDAVVLYDDSPSEYQVAILQTENGTPAASNRIYISDKDSAKGITFSPLQSLNNTLMRPNNFDETGGYDPLENQIYTPGKPVYVRNLREAEDNVREVPTDFNNSNR